MAMASGISTSDAIARHARHALELAVVQSLSWIPPTKSDTPKSNPEKRRQFLGVGTFKVQTVVRRRDGA